VGTPQMSRDIEKYVFVDIPKEREYFIASDVDLDSDDDSDDSF
jgi:hypothetical protein